MPSEVLDGRELGDVIDELARARVRGTRGAWGVLTLDLIACQDSFRSAILAALAPFYNTAVCEAPNDRSCVE
jgi:non-canonical (house-cleaning) NTP pyrophosphatase